MTASCKIDDCDNPAAARGWCKPHYMIAYRHDGDPLAAPLQGSRRPCSAEGCKKRTSSESGYCPEHHRNWERTGDPLLYVNPLIKEVPTYHRAHQRIYEQRGRASDRWCPCGDPAEEWALTGEPKWFEPVNGKGYTDDVYAYTALCGPCHRRRDRPHQHHCPHGEGRRRSARGDCLDCHADRQRRSKGVA